MLLVLYPFSLFLQLTIKVIPFELALVLCFLANEKTLFTVAFDADFILLHLDCLVDIEFEHLNQTSVGILLRTLQVEALIELNLGQKAVDVLRSEVECRGVPFTEDTVLIVNHLLPLVVQSDGQHLETDRTLQVPHAVVVLIGGIVCADLVQAMSAGELLYFFLLHAEATHGLLASDAQVHFIADEKTTTLALVLNIWRLI